MRNATLLLLAPTTLLGCFSSSSGGSGPDASFNMQQDAEFMDSGSSDSSMAIDSSVDASVDSSTMDVMTVVEAGVDAPVEAGSGPIKVVVTNLSGPEQGVTVLFSDSSGAPLAAPETTDATGSVVEPTLPPGAQMTIIMGTAAVPYFFTVQGVAQGDTVAVYDPTADEALNGNDNVSIDSWPAAAPPATTTYQVATGSRCFANGSAPPILDSVYYQCEAAGQFPILLTAEDANFQPTGYTWQKGNILPTDGGVDHVNLTNAWSTTTDTQTVVSSGAPAFLAGDNANLAFTFMATGVPSATLATGSSVMADGGMTWPFTYPDGYPDWVQAEADLYQYLNQAATVTSVATRLATPTGSGSVSVDLSQALPTFQSSTIDTTTDAGASQPAVTWSLLDAGSIAAADGIIATLLWNDTGVSGRWVIVAPPTSTLIQPPAIPSAASASAPSSNATWAPVPSVTIVQATFFQGYPGLRAQAGVAGLTALIANSYGGGQVVVPPLTAEGTLQMSAISTNGD